MSCAVCKAKGEEGIPSVIFYSPPIHLPSGDVYLYQGECKRCGGKTAICLTSKEVCERIKAGWYDNNVEAVK